MRGITKEFPGVLANDRVDFEAAAGEVHALLGENGAGKTTLSNILTGLYSPDAGEIELYGEPARFESPRDALDAGICMVHQHFRLVEPFTVAENIVLGDHRAESRSLVVRARCDRAPRVRARRALRTARAPPRSYLAALGGRAAARRDPEGALPRGPHPDPRRADGSAHAS